MSKLSSVTRLEIIDYTECDSCDGEGTISIYGHSEVLECPACHGSATGAREVVFIDETKQVQASLQDDGRTLKLFISRRIV